MNALSTFPNLCNVAIIGASGGIGKAFVNELSNCEAIDKIYTFSRKEVINSNTKIEHFTLDICDEKQIQSVVKNIDTPLHLVIIASGILHDGEQKPEKNLNALTEQAMQHAFNTNTIGPALIAKHFIPLFAKNEKSVFAALSARVGSISDNNLGGWYSYRASKAALNMIIKTTAIEAARKYKKMSVIGLHPGTVDTNLSSPYQSNVKQSKLFTPTQSARYLLNVINHVSHKDTGKIFDWNNQEIKP